MVEGLFSFTVVFLVIIDVIMFLNFMLEFYYRDVEKKRTIEALTCILRTKKGMKTRCVRFKNTMKRISIKCKRMRNHTIDLHR